MRTLLSFLVVGVAVATDVATFGGVCNDGYFRNGRRTYTQTALDELFPRPRR